jgi:hypothetical protein
VAGYPGDALAIAGRQSGMGLQEGDSNRAKNAPLLSTPFPTSPGKLGKRGQLQGLTRVRKLRESGNWVHGGHPGG